MPYRFKVIWIDNGEMIKLGSNLRNERYFIMPRIFLHF